jgi:putative endonuclease
VPADARRGDGAAAEAIAADHLKARGLAVVERNVRSRHGEIDVVMRDGDTLVFVEVRLRRPGRYASAAESVTTAKRARMVAAAREYLARLPRTPPCRFDVVLLDGLDAARVEWLRDVIDGTD